MRSIDDGLRVRLRLVGEGDLESDLEADAGGEGVMGKYVVTVGERGVSSRLGADFEAFGFAGFVDAMASNALILDCMPTDTSGDMAVVAARARRGGGRATGRWRRRDWKRKTSKRLRSARPNRVIMRIDARQGLRRLFGETALVVRPPRPSLEVLWGHLNAIKAPVPCLRDRSWCPGRF